MNKALKGIIIARDDVNPQKGREYCTKHGEDITIIHCQWCIQDLDKAIQLIREGDK